MKLTQTQKLHALAYRFYQGAAWTPKAGDFYTTSRADLELYQVVSIEGGLVRTRYTEGSEAISEWPEAGFLTEGFGPKRVFVPEWVLNLRAIGDDHPDSIAVDRFADAMKAKLAQKRAEGRGGWEGKEQCTAFSLSELLHDHVRKGDPVDVGNLAMMLHQRGEAILTTPTAPIEQAGVTSELLEAAYLLGWQASAEGWNAEYGCDHRENTTWLSDRDAAISSLADLKVKNESTPAEAMADGWVKARDGRFDDLSPDGSIGAFGGSGQWIELCTVAELRKLAAAPQPAPPADLRDENEGITRIAHQLPWAEKNVRLEEENERLRQRLNHYIKATTDKNSDLIAAEARLKALEADAGILLAQLDAFQEATGERLEAEDAAIVEAIRATLKGGE